MNPVIIGISGRSGSGKTTIVQGLTEQMGREVLTVHTMDNYYIPREEQIIDSKNYRNFDLPESFYRERFYQDLVSLKGGRKVSLVEYVYNNETDPRVIEITPAPVILVEGLFIYHYTRVRAMLDLKILVDIDFQEAYRRRKDRDQRERNYQISEISHRYENHAEPAYLSFIEPFRSEMDLVLVNDQEPQRSIDRIRAYIEKRIGSLDQ
jgi:uridine kinase